MRAGWQVRFICLYIKVFATDWPTEATEAHFSIKASHSLKKVSLYGFHRQEFVFQNNSFPKMLT